MKKILAVLPVVLFGHQSAAHHDNTLTYKNCDKLNWAALETNPEGPPDYSEYSSPIKQTKNEATDYTNIFKKLCE